MNCPNCHQKLEAGSYFCGNCGFNLSEPGTKNNVGQAQQSPGPANQYVQNNSMPNQNINQLGSKSTNNGKAIASFVLGLVGLIAWLIPIVGLIMGIVGVVLGILGRKSRKKVLSIIGIVLSSIVIILSIFVLIISANAFIKGFKQGLNSSNTNSNSSYSGTYQAINTSCYKTKIPINLNITQTTGSCTFQATNNITNEVYSVKVINAPSITPTNLESASKLDAQNVVNSVAGSKIKSQQMTTFVGSPAYSVTFVGADNNHAEIDYVYKVTSQGNILVVAHSQNSSSNYDLSIIEKYWSWL